MLTLKREENADTGISEELTAFVLFREMQITKKYARARKRGKGDKKKDRRKSRINSVRKGKRLRRKEKGKTGREERRKEGQREGRKGKKKRKVER